MKNYILFVGLTALMNIGCGEGISTESQTTITTGLNQKDCNVCARASCLDIIDECRLDDDFLDLNRCYQLNDLSIQECDVSFKAGKLCFDKVTTCIRVDFCKDKCNDDCFDHVDDSLL